MTHISPPTVLAIGGLAADPPGQCPVCQQGRGLPETPRNNALPGLFFFFSFWKPPASLSHDPVLPSFQPLDFVTTGSLWTLTC